MPVSHPVAAPQSAPPLHFTSLADSHMVGDVVDVFVAAARKLGYDVSVEHASLRRGAVNIVCFAHHLAPDALQGLGPDCIVMNFEQLVEESQAFNESYLRLLRSHYVWDYSLHNLARYAELGIGNGHHVPLGYEAEAGDDFAASESPGEVAQDIDVLFFGSLNERRADVLAAMRRRGLHVVSNEGALWDTAHRDRMIERASLVLNMHYFDNSRIVEIPRLAMLFRRRKAILCELYADSEIFYPELRGAVAGAPRDRLADMAVLLRSAPELRRRLGRRGFEAFSARAQTAVLGPALERFLAWRSREHIASPEAG